MKNFDKTNNTNRINLITTLLFIIYIGLFFVLQILLPTSTFSQYENRILSTMPEFNSQSFFSGDYTTKLDTYITDQFPYRNFWISLKASNEFILGKKENGLVYFGDNLTLIDKFTAVDYKVVDSNLRRIEQFNSQVEVPVHLALIPTQSAIYEYKLDINTPYESQMDVIDYTASYLNSITLADYTVEPNNSTDNSGHQSISFVDLYTSLHSHKDEYIYYNSDHHFTSLGAYYTYQSLGTVLGYTAKELDEYTLEIVSNNFQGTSHSKSPIPWFHSDTIHTYVPNQEIQLDNGAGLESGLLYDVSKLEKKNQYEYFLGGNPPLAVIPGTGSGALLLIRDSYSNALVPFLIAHFESIHMVDLRTCRYSMSEYIHDNKIDQVLICYSIPNFTTDKNLAYLR